MQYVNNPSHVTSHSLHHAHAVVTLSSDLQDLQVLGSRISSIRNRYEERMSACCHNDTYTSAHDTDVVCAHTSSARKMITFSAGSDSSSGSSSSYSGSGSSFNSISSDLSDLSSSSSSGSALSSNLTPKQLLQRAVRYHASIACTARGSWAHHYTLGE